MSVKSKISQKFTVSVIVIALLVLYLCITTFAVGVAVGNDVFPAGEVKINLNDGKPVINENEFLFEPGMTVEKEFFLENQSTWDVDYKLYFDNIEGSLADVLDVTVLEGDNVLLAGKISELTRVNVGAADKVLRFNEHKNLTVLFHFPEDAGNSTQNQQLSFTVNADAQHPDVVIEAPAESLPAGTTPDNPTPMPGPADNSHPNDVTDLPNENLPENKVPLPGSADGTHICCILHLLIMLAALIVTVFYTSSIKKHQRKIFDIRRKIEENRHNEANK